MPSTTLPHTRRPLVFVRHGATAPNLAGLRCGGDLDVPLTEAGRLQAAEAAQKILALNAPVGVIVCSNLLRTRETAAIISRALHGVEVLIEPAFAERSLGGWNMRSIAETEAELAAGVTPPGGESNAQFLQRVCGAVQTLVPLLDRQPLLVGSKGVARALTELLGLKGRHGQANGEVAQFDLAEFSPRNLDHAVAARAASGGLPWQEDTVARPAPHHGECTA
jgi:2,3-bisphosphoglycerate-dependent phosphoglycerate mutase